MKEKISGHILIIDDDPIQGLLLKEMLKKGSFTHKYINDGRNIISILEKESIDLILLDILMPNISGYEVCNLIRSDNRFCEIPIIFLSASNSKKDVVKGFEIGGQDFIVKPFNAQELILRIKSQLLTQY